MNTSDFYYDLPKELIAQTPLARRDASRLLFMNRQTGSLTHMQFDQIGSLLRPGDLLVVNDSKVIPARIFGVNTATGGHMEFLLLKPTANGCWEVLAKPGKRAKPGTVFSFGDGLLLGEVTDILEDGKRSVQFSCVREGDNLYGVLDEIGRMPLPPYITEALEDQSRYQTVYAKHSGSAAAPTAGLHFTPELLQQLQNSGINTASVTLHVGLGTFRPVKVEKIEDHLMHTEHYRLDAQTADLINQTKQAGGRVIAVGTTSCRTLESVAQKCPDGIIRPMEGDTGIFIYPGYKFGLIDGLVTNFHLPESTLIMLVSAFASRESVLHAYAEAVAERYRFFSFGDAMVIL